MSPEPTFAAQPFGVKPPTGSGARSERPARPTAPPNIAAVAPSIEPLSIRCGHVFEQRTRREVPALRRGAERLGLREACLPRLRETSAQQGLGDITTTSPAPPPRSPCFSCADHIAWAPAAFRGNIGRPRFVVYPTGREGALLPYEKRRAMSVTIAFCPTCQRDVHLAVTSPSPVRSARPL